MNTITSRYVNGLNKKDVKKQIKEIQKTKEKYKKQNYHIRPKMKSFTSKPSRHVLKARKLYNINSLHPSKELAKKTGCQYIGLQKIMKKGQGAYYSSGSRPSQTPHSWGIARLASSLTGGKASGIDLHILKQYCDKNSIALKKAKTVQQGQAKTKKYKVKNIK